MLTNDKALYKKLESTVQNICFEIHAIYEPDGGEGFGDCYCAAVDLFKQGMTYRVYFKSGENGNIEVEHIERWFFG